MRYYKVQGKRRTKVAITKEDALNIAKELFKLTNGHRELLLKHPCGVIFFEPAPTPDTVYRIPNVFTRIGVIKAPGKKCSDLGLDPKHPPCRGPYWEDADIFELIKTLADRIYTHPEKYIRPGW